MQQVNSVLLIDDDSIFNMISKKIIQIAKFAPKVESYLDATAALDESSTCPRMSLVLT